VSLSAALDSTCLFPTNSIGLIAELSAEVPQAQHAGTQDHESRPNEQQQEAAGRHHNQTCHVGTTSVHPGILQENGLFHIYLPAGLPAAADLWAAAAGLLLAAAAAAVQAAAADRPDLGKNWIGLLFPTPPLTISLTSLTAHLPSPNSI
jgi:hypothetical protein